MKYDMVSGRDSETSQMASRIGRALAIFIDLYCKLRIDDMNDMTMN